MSWGFGRVFRRFTTSCDTPVMILDEQASCNNLNCELFLQLKFLDTFWRHILTTTINRRHKHTVSILGHGVDHRYRNHILSFYPFGPIKCTQIFIFCMLETGDMGSCWILKGSKGSYRELYS